MHTLTILLLPIVLSACVQLPENNPQVVSADTFAVSNWLLPLIERAERIQISMCKVENPRLPCFDRYKGLEATGIGGFLLPLKVSVPSMTMQATHAELNVIINGKDAACTSGLVEANTKSNVVEISNIFCNWLIIGNVVSKLKLSIDWEDPVSRTFGGRYAILFFGTGNGAGSGIYSAQVQS